MSWIPRKYLKRTNNEICFGSCLHFSLEKECFRFYIPFWHWVQKNKRFFEKYCQFQIPVQVLKKPGNVMENCPRGHAFFYIFLNKNLKKYIWNWLKITKKKKKECVCGAFPPFPTQPNLNSSLFQIICSDITQFWERKKIFAETQFYSNEAWNSLKSSWKSHFLLRSEYWNLHRPG